jgi:hypothetical protein
MAAAPPTNIAGVSAMTMLCLLLTLTAAAAGLSAAAEPEIILPGPGGSPADIDREVLWIDTPDIAGNAVTSEIISEYGLESEYANDLFLEQPATIRKVTWWGVYWNGYEGEPTGAGFNLRFYNDDGSCFPEDPPFLEFLLPGDVCCEQYFDGGDHYSQFEYELCLAQDFSAGPFWFSAQMADHEFPPEWGRLGADMIRLCGGAFRSEYFSYPEWVRGPDVFGCECEGSQMFEDECVPTATETTSWGRVRLLYR